MIQVLLSKYITECQKKRKTRTDLCLSKDSDMLVDSGIIFICTIGKVKQKVMLQDMENVNLALHRSRFEGTRMKIYYISKRSENPTDVISFRLEACEKCLSPSNEKNAIVE